MEGDTINLDALVPKLISIHALRVEGDHACSQFPVKIPYFYPRPPGGGRPSGGWRIPVRVAISIHALRVEGDRDSEDDGICCKISIHALRVEGDRDFQ